MRKIGLAIPTFNRPQMTIQSFMSVYNDERVAQVTIVDDASDDSKWQTLSNLCKPLDKVKLVRNATNLDCYANKFTAICHSDMEWNCLWDSDNSFDVDYLNKIFSIQDWQPNTAYLPSFAAPHFDYRKYEGLEITKDNVGQCAHDATFTTMLNTANYFVNRDFYMQCWDENIDPHTADSIYMNFRYLKNGGKLYVVPGLTYNHRVDDHKGEQAGHYVTNLHKTPIGFHDSIVNNLRHGIF
jgi:glycosyltransferase involved in cell wall biosynthesis